MRETKVSCNALEMSCEQTSDSNTGGERELDISGHQDEPVTNLDEDQGVMISVDKELLFYYHTHLHPRRSQEYHSNR